MIEFIFWLKQLVKLIVLPPNGPLLLIIGGLAIAGRKPVTGRRIALAGTLLLVVLAMPVVASLMTRALDRSPVLEPGRAVDAQAIVILGGGTRRYAPEYRGATMSGLTLERVRFGARIARATGLPILVSGGALRGAPAEAVMMRNALVSEFGVPVRWIEAHSHNTHENAEASAAILKAAGVQRIILIGHAFDFPRTRDEFEAAGLTVTSAPIGVPSAGPYTWVDFVPNIAGLQGSYFACYEWLANTLYRIIR
jgi:uncharacterized SAM-binding protein YcdF (DUF218 family)